MPTDNAPDSHLETAARLLAEGRADAALAMLFEAWSNEPENIDLAVSYATLLAQAEREGEAEELFSSLAEESPDDGRVWNNWGYLLMGRGEIDGAIAKLRRALDICPHDFEAMVNMGIALDRLGRVEESLNLYRQAVDLHPDSPVAHNNMGAALWRSGKPEEALAAFRRALQLNPRDASAANNMGIIKLAQGELDEAEGLFRQTLAIDPGSQAALRNLNAAAKQRKQSAKKAAANKEETKCEKPRSLF